MDDGHFVDTSLRGVCRCGWVRRARKKVKPRLTKKRPRKKAAQMHAF